MRWASLVLLMMLAPSTATAISLIPTGTVAGPIGVDVKGSVFVRARSIHLEGVRARTELALTRARLGIDLRWKEYVRIQIEPDFAELEVDLADAFLEVSPIKEIELLAGRAKVPYGELELESRWNLPSISRGLVSDLVSDRLGIGGRRLGVKASMRLKQFDWRPGIDAGAYRDTVDDSKTDGAVRLEVRPYFKGSELSLAGYAKGQAEVSLGYGFAGALAFSYDKKGLYLVVEGMVVRAALLRKLPTDENATLTAGRLLVAYAIEWDDLSFQPFVGAEIVDPNIRTRSDLGGAVRGGLNLLFAKVVRVGLEIDHRRGQEAFSEVNRTLATVFVGVSLE